MTRKLHFLSVKKEYTNRGIGYSLLRRAIDEVKRSEKEMVYVYTEAGASIENFFIKNGFKKVGNFKSRFGKGRDANIFSLYL